MKISSGPNKGFYNLPGVFINDNSVVRPSEVYTRWKLDNNKQITGFNKTWLPYFDGYYFVPKLEGDVDVRKLLYALETKEMPSSGNTETFLREFNRVVVPSDYCPRDVDPCDYDWCEKCNQKITFAPKDKKNSILELVSRNAIIYSFLCVLAMLLASSF